MKKQSKPFKALSWGMGAPSTSLGVLSALGHLDPLDLIITADTAWERKATYEARDFYIEWFRDHGMRVEVIEDQDIRVQGAAEHVHMPFWTSTGGPLRRQCTREFKIRPIKRRVREIMGYDRSRPPHPPAGAVETWLGYTWEEVGRQRESDVSYITHRYPLIKKRWTRENCQGFLAGLGLPVPVKSACVGCPYRTAGEWVELKLESPGEFQDAVDFDEANRVSEELARAGRDTDYLYILKDPRTDNPVPLKDADLEAMAAWQKRKGTQGMLNFCEGPCGT